MALDSTPLSERFAFRSESEPTNAPDGATWIDPSGGSGGDNVEQYLYDGTSDTWTLIRSVGPDEPTDPADGALWIDTDSGAGRTYVSGSWFDLGYDVYDQTLDPVFYDTDVTHPTWNAEIDTVTAITTSSSWEPEASLDVPLSDHTAAIVGAEVQNVDTFNAENSNLDTQLFGPDRGGNLGSNPNIDQSEGWVWVTTSELFAQDYPGDLTVELIAKTDEATSIDFEIRNFGWWRAARTSEVD